MKKLLIMSIALVAIMATVFTVSAFAANTVTIDEITLSKYIVDVEGVATMNDAYANVTVKYTVAEDTAGAVDRLTFYLAAQELSAALEGEEAKVIYIDEQVEADAGSLTFVIEKARVRTAFTSAGKIDSTLANGAAYAAAEGLKLTFKLGGTEVDTADELEVVYKNPTYYGDVSCDGLIDAKDVSMLTRAAAKKLNLNSERFVSADIDASNILDAKDVSLVTRLAAKKQDYGKVLSNIHKYNY